MMVWTDPRSLDGEELDAIDPSEDLEIQVAAIQPLYDALTAPEWRSFAAYLDDLHAKALDDLVHKTDPTLVARLQGRVSLIRDILRLPDDTAARLKSLLEQMEEK